MPFGEFHEHAATADRLALLRHSVNSSLNRIIKPVAVGNAQERYENTLQSLWRGASQRGRAFVVFRLQGQVKATADPGGQVMRFKNREEAGRLLADRLSQYRGRHPLVLGIPRGAVPMAKIIADALQGDLDVVLVHKLRAPFQPELAIGAIDEAGNIYRCAVGVEIPAEDVALEVRTQLEVLRQRRLSYTRARGPLSATGRIAIIVDDGIATGSSMLAAIRAMRRQKPEKLIVATAVAPPESLSRVTAESDEVVCLYTSEEFYAVGQFFDDFSTVCDQDVVEILGQAQRSAASA
jgi:predicted phosphoribosyltransferase